MHVHVCTLVLDIYYTAVFSISSYGAPLSQRASYLAQHCSLFWPDAQLIMIILSLTASTPQNVFPMVHTLIWPIWPIWPIRPMLQNLSKTLLYTIVYTGILHLPYVCGLCIVPVFPSRDGTMVLLVIKILKLLYNTP